MALFGSKKNVFCTLLLRGSSCKVIVRQIASKNRVTKSVKTTINFASKDELNERLGEIMSKFNAKKRYICALMSSPNQHLSEELSTQKDYIVEAVSDEYAVCVPKSEAAWIRGVISLNIDECMSALKLMYFLIKNQEFKGTCMFVIKFKDSVCVAYANDSSVLSVSMYDYEKECIKIATKASNSASFSDSEEFFYELVKDKLSIFYSGQNSDFIDKIFIYDASGVDKNMSYYFFKNLLIQTELVPIDILDFANKINIKENY
ncbi:MAG: hypothetical protein MR902_08485 [Campylobacter sp.]|nr:hypothetical protein [Campylobacter sp.]